MQATKWPAPGLRVVVSEFAETPPEAVESKLALQSMEAPDPAKIGARDVIVEIAAASVGWVDLLMTSGQYQHLPKPPYCPGLEYAGIVVHKGPEVGDRIVIGDRVIVDPFLAGPRSHGPYQSHGGFASYSVAPEEAVLPIPGELDFAQAANLLGNYETAYHVLVTRGRLQPNETVLIHGASGSTGLAAVQIAKLIGAKVIATGRSADKLAIVKHSGADHVLRLSRADGEPGIRAFRDDVKELTGGKRVDVVYDGVGGEISVESIHACRFGARFLIVGWASTPFVARGKASAARPTPINCRPI